ncbi:MAG: MOSC domain-containing protein [Candidatus Poribacteria bacterium]|nr:MOSC domain-containing protein [Candidatus Poribacteria bacterium]
MVKLLSVNVSQPKDVAYNGKMVRTGIFKEPVKGRVWLRKLGLDGDGHGDLSVHGGIDKAVYAYPVEHYEYWARELGRNELPFGQFGENLTVEGLLEEKVHVGDVFQVAGARVQVTQPRVPCFKLGLKMGCSTFPKHFLTSERSGFYLRVIAEGDIGAGDFIERIRIDPARLSIKEVHHLYYFDNLNRQGIEKVLDVPALSDSWRESFEGFLEKCDSVGDERH